MGGQAYDPYFGRSPLRDTRIKPLPRATVESARQTVSKYALTNNMSPEHAAELLEALGLDKTVDDQVVDNL